MDGMAPKRPITLELIDDNLVAQVLGLVPEKPLFRDREIAALVSLSRSAVAAARARGELRFVRRGRACFVTHGELIRWISEDFLINESRLRQFG